MNLWNMGIGDTFVFDDDPHIILVYLGMDGMYAKVRALDPAINKEMCSRYDANSDFFAIFPYGSVTPRVPPGFEMEKKGE